MGSGTDPSRSAGPSHFAPGGDKTVGTGVGYHGIQAGGPYPTGPGGTDGVRNGRLQADRP